MTENSQALRILFGRGAIYTVALAAQLSAGLITLPLLTRLLDPEQFGVVAAATVIRQILTVVVGLGVPAAISRFAFDAEDGRGRARALLTTVVAFSIVGAALAEVTGPLWSSMFADLQYGSALRIANWSAVPVVAGLGVLAMLRAEDRAGWFVTVALISTVASQLAGLGALALFDRTAEWYLGGLTVGYAAAALVGLALYRPTLRGLSDRTLIRQALVYGSPTVLHALALHVITGGDRVVLERLDSLEAVARYHVAYLIGGLSLALVGALNNAWGPLIFGAAPESRWSVLAATSSVVMRLTAAVVGGIALAAPIGLALGAPDTYASDELVPVVAVVALASIPFTWYIANVHIIYQVGKTGVLAVVTPLVAAVNIVANFALIPRFGILGAAYATVGSYMLQSWLIQRSSKRLANVEWETTPLLLAAGGGSALAALGALLPTDGVWLAIRLLGALALGLLILREGRRFTKGG
ncbi:MAG: oligosaccharide flippase family protein [Acidimicrobiia bacterium]|nr:oligosaccharide flippase family protein [Acidimicrobiia bacterium]NNF63075.1 oligosaccharide flippase family protein [Acidimicrobiia bacterium]